MKQKTVKITDFAHHTIVYKFTIFIEKSPDDLLLLLRFQMHIQCTLYYSMRPVEWRCAWQGSDTGRLRDSVNMTKSSTSRLHSFYTHYHYKELTSLMVAKFDSYQMLHLHIGFQMRSHLHFYANMHIAY